MIAVVLVGGTGTRLRPLTLTVPKQVLPIVEVPMIERVLAYLETHGVEEAVLSLGYLHGAFQALFPDGRCGNVRLTYAVEPEPLDTAGAVGFAARHAGVSERFLVVNGDVLTDLDITAMVAFHEERGAEATISLTMVEDPSAFGLVPIDPDGKVLAFVEKPAPGTVGASYINAGTYVLEPSVLDHIPEGQRISIERQVFPLLAAAGTVYDPTGTLGRAHGACVQLGLERSGFGQRRQRGFGLHGVTGVLAGRLRGVGQPVALGVGHFVHPAALGTGELAPDVQLVGLEDAETCIRHRGRPPDRGDRPRGRSPTPCSRRRARSGRTC